MLLEETVKVIDVGDGRVLVSSDSQSACQSCEAKSQCGQKTLAAYFSGDREGHARSIWINVPSTFGSIAIGERLVLLVDSSAMLKGALLTYSLPLLMSFLSGFLVHSMMPFSRELGTAIAAGLGLFGGFFLAKWCIHTYSLDPSLTPTLKRRVLAST